MKVQYPPLDQNQIISHHGRKQRPKKIMPDVANEKENALSQAGLEAEVARLKCLLVDIRGRIEGEIGSFTYQKRMPTNQNIVNPIMTGRYVMSPCNMQCGDQVYCLHPEVDGKVGKDASIHDPVLNGCDFENLQCLEN
ncbi:hypothetical protein Tco_1042991 [Tanacetum coccineum]|uniref:Uncharacterized protein n=1 Tax=Tanacetum coccineum TaxID=301880 RepID=A0ABQ5GKX7_9ASTR